MAEAEHKPLPVAGYNAQPQEKVDLVNGMKEREERLLRDLDYLKDKDYIDQRWLQIGRTAIEQGFMAINRSVFQPGRVALPEDSDTSSECEGGACSIPGATAGL